MKIAFFSECWDPQINGVVTSTKALSSSFVEPHDSVFVFTPRYPRFKDTDPNIFRQAAIQYVFQPEFYFANPLPYRALKAARNWGIDIIHMHTEFTLGMAASRVARALRIPCILTLHTLWEHYSHYFFWNILPRNLIRFFLSLLYTMPDYFIAPSQKAKDYLENTLHIKKPIEIIPTGILLDKFYNARLQGAERDTFRSQWGIAPKDIVLLFAGRIGEEKSIDVLIKGLAVLIRTYPSIKLMLVGGGPHLERLKRYAESLRLSPHVVFTGYIPYEKMPLVYRAADIFTIASVSETQGLVTVEALASGLPVIVKNDAANNEIIDNGRYGLIFNNAEEFPATVDRLLSDKALLARLKETACQGSERFDAPRYGKRVREYYEWIIKDYKQRRK